MTNSTLSTPHRGRVNTVPTAIADETAPQSVLKWGMVGTGAISQEIAADFALTTGAVVTAVCSRDSAKAEEFGKAFDIPARYTDFASMLDSGIDAVYIATPHATHFELAREALKSGCHVLCEKPLGLDADEVRKLAEIARESGCFLMEAMWMKFNPLYTHLRGLVGTGEIGEVRSVRSSFGAPWPQDGSSRWQPGGSALLNQGIYSVTISHMLLGQPSRVEAAGQMRADGVDLSGHFTLEYPDGRFAHGASSMVEFLDQSASVGGTLGWISIDAFFWFASTLTVHRYGASGYTATPHQVATEGNGYVPMLRAVTEAIADGLREHPLHTLDETARIFDSLDEIRSQFTSMGGD